LNSKKTMKIDFRRVPKDMISGLIGFTQPIDRVKQLSMIRRSRSQNKSFLKGFSNT